MNLKKASLRFFGLILFLLLLVVTYLLLTINRKPIITEQIDDNEEMIYIVPNAVATLSDESDKIRNEIEQDIQFPLNDIHQVSTQITFSGDKSVKNKVINFNPTGSKSYAEAQFGGKPQFNQQSKDGVTYYINKNKPNTYYFFLDDHTLVVTEDLSILSEKTMESKATEMAKLNPKEGLAFNFSKGDPVIEHFTNNVPEYIINKFQSISGKISYNEKNASYIEIKMESALIARTLELVLPSIIAQIKDKVIKVNGQFVINGTNVTLSPQDMDLLKNSQQYITIKSSKSSVYILNNGSELSTYLLDVLINVIIGD